MQKNKPVKLLSEKQHQAKPLQPHYIPRKDTALRKEIQQVSLENASTTRFSHPDRDNPAFSAHRWYFLYLIPLY